MKHLIPVVAFAVLASQDEPSLKPLTEVAKRLDQGIEAFLAGKDMKESFKEWDAGETAEPVIAKLRGDLTHHHVAKAKTFAVDLRLLFLAEGAQVYEVKALIYATGEETGLIAFQGKPTTGAGSAKTSVTPDKLAKDAKPFGDAGSALFKLLKTKKTEELPFADLKKIAPLIPPAFRDPAQKALDNSKSEAEKVRKELNDLKFDEMKVQLDEQYFSALGSEGLSKDGWIRGKLRFTPEGGVTFRLSRFEVK